jgi:hypothetical protein
MNPFYYIGSAVIACGFIFVGWGGEGYLSNICLIIGGFGFGALITDALNYNETKPNNTTKEEG